jgi:hypothetical protein
MAGEWYETALDAETLAHAEAKGWKDADATKVAAAAIKAHLGAEKLIGHPADQVLKLPKDGTDPSFQAIYERVTGMATPPSADAYKFDGVKFKDGSDLTPEDVTFVRDLAIKYKLPAPAAQGIAAELAARADGSDATETAMRETTRAANRAHLMQAWGADFDRKSFSALNAIEAAGLPKTILEHIAALPAPEYRTAMDAVVALGEKMGEAAMLRGGSAPRVDSTAGLAPPEAEARLSALQGDKVWAQKFLAGDVAARDEWTKLCTIIASGRVAR